MRLTPEQVKPELVGIQTLSTHPENPRRGDVRMIADSVRHHGVFRTIVVSSDNVVLAGNHTYLAAFDQGECELWVSRVPFKHDDPQARQIMLVDNRAADLGAYDDEALARVLTELKDDELLDGTGYDEDQVDAIVKLLNEEEQEPEQPESKERECPACGHVWKP